MTADPNADRLASIRARADAATAGPWRESNPLPHGSGTPMPDAEPAAIAKQLSGLVGWRSPADAAFIAAAREDVPFLLDQLAAAEARLALIAESDMVPQRDVDQATDNDIEWMNRAIAAEAKIAQAQIEADRLHAWIGVHPTLVLREKGLAVSGRLQEALSASPVSALDAVRADERKEWADYFEHWGQSVATPEFTQERAVSALRGTKPFGVTATQMGATDAHQ